MYKKYGLLVIIVYFICTACSTNSGTNYEVAISISFVDQNGQDLLNPRNQNAITEQNTDLYYQIEGNLVKQFKANLDHPKMFQIPDEKSPYNDNYFLVVYSNIIENQDMALTYLEFEDNSMDTIKTQYEITDHSTFVTKVWYNDDLKCNVYDKENTELESTKYGSCYFIITRNRK